MRAKNRIVLKQFIENRQSATINDPPPPNVPDVPEPGENISSESSDIETFEEDTENNQGQNNADGLENGILDRVFQFFLNHNLTLSALEDLLKLVNEIMMIVGATEEKLLPSSKYLFKKIYQAGHSLKFHTKCGLCKEISTKSNTSEQRRCDNCDVECKPNQNNFFVSLSLATQLKDVVEINFPKIREYVEKVVNLREIDSKIRDIHNSRLYKENITEKHTTADYIPITLTINTDGVPVFKSKKSTLWPVFAYVNELPPQVRFKSENIIVIALYYTEKEDPDMVDILKPFITEIKDLQLQGIECFVAGERVIIKPFLLACCMDLKAQPLITKLIQYNGRFSCCLCKQEGTSIDIENKNRTVRQIRYTFNPCELRTNDEIVQQMIEANDTGGTVEGIQGINPLIVVASFEPVHSIVYDYMHGCLLGVTRQITELYLSTSNKNQPFFIGDRMKDIDRRLLNIRPPSYIKRKPRSIESRNNWKAIEWKNWLLFYAVPCLKTILNDQFLRHLILLISSLHYLLGVAIEKTKLPSVERNLMKFVKDFQEYFGESQMTMNIHKITHLVKSVENCGPIWAYSAFAFESKNGQLLKYVKGTRDVLVQIATKCVLSQHLYRRNKKTFYKNDVTRSLGKIRSYPILNPNLKYALSISPIRHLIIGIRINIYVRYLYKSVVYTSSQYTMPQKSIDYVIKLKDGSIGEIKFFVESMNEAFVVLHKLKPLKVTKIESEFLHCVKNSNSFLVCSIDNIDSKCVCVEIGSSKRYVYSLPNDFESD